MSGFSSSRLLARTSLLTTVPRCTAPSAPQWTRLFSQSTTRQQDHNPLGNSRPPNPMQTLASKDVFTQDMMRNASNPTGGLTAQLGMDDTSTLEPYHFHIYSHKHNTHITVTDPNRDAIISMSCGNLGLRNAQRKSYDAAYQLAAFVVDKLHQKGVVKKIHKLEVVLRGFGPGREAATKVLLGTEGKMLRPLITRVTDSTRTKFGGTRSQKKRRLG